MARRLILAFAALTIPLAFNTPARAESGKRARPGKPGRRIEIVCHRGANHLAPENTRASAQKAVELGADYVEVDVRTTADGTMIIIHDHKVDRTTDGEGFVRKLTADQIAKLDAGSWFDPTFKGERIPRLRPFLEWIRGKAKVYFDVKDADLPELIRWVHELKMDDDVFFWFGNMLQARRFRKLTKTLPLKINVKDVETLRQAKRRFDPQIVETGVDQATPELIAEAHKLGIKVMILYTGNDKAVFKRILHSGADMVNLDRLRLFLEAEREVAATQPAR